MKIFILLFFISFYSLAQTQIGQSIEVDDMYFAFGSSISTSSDGKIIAVGGYGKSEFGFRVYEEENSEFIQLGQDINSNLSNSTIVYVVSLSSNGYRVAVAYINGVYGFIKIYDLINSNWVQVGNAIYGENTSDIFGLVLELSADGNRLIAGAKFNNNSTGHARVYEFNGNDWIQLGSDIDGDESGNYYGSSISISKDGNRVAVGANQYHVNGAYSGLIRVFEYNGTDWFQLGEDLNGISDDHFGISSALNDNGNILIVGANRPLSIGYSKVFEYDESGWVQFGNTINGINSSDRFGRDVSISNDGNRIAIGAPIRKDIVDRPAYSKIFEFYNSTWFQLGETIDSEYYGDEFGERIAISSDGNRVLIGGLTYIYQQSGTESGYAGLYDLSNLVLSLNNFNASTISIFPNPAIETIQFSSYQDISRVSLYNFNGKLINENINLIEKYDVSNLKSGVYIFKIITNNNETKTIKLIKK